MGILTPLIAGFIPAIQPRRFCAVNDSFREDGVFRAADAALLDSRHKGGYEGGRTYSFTGTV